MQAYALVMMTSPPDTEGKVAPTGIIVIIDDIIIMVTIVVRISDGDVFMTIHTRVIATLSCFCSGFVLVLPNLEFIARILPPAVSTNPCLLPAHVPDTVKHRRISRRCRRSFDFVHQKATHFADQILL